MEPLTIDAVYENGILKPERPLPFSEHERVRISVQPAVDIVDRTAGMFGWKGDAETLERIASDPEFGIEESP